MEQVYEETRMKSIADMFCVTTAKDCREDDGGHGDIISSSEKKVDPQNSFKSSVPKLPRIDEHILRIVILDDDAVYQNWKGTVYTLKLILPYAITIVFFEIKDVYIYIFLIFNYFDFTERVHNSLKEKGLWKEEKLSPLRLRQRERRLAKEAK